MIRDVTGTKLTPGNFVKDCLGDGRHFDKKGKRIECCCNECGYLLCCTEEDFEKACGECVDLRCPRCKNKISAFFRFVHYLFIESRGFRKTNNK